MIAKNNESKNDKPIYNEKKMNLGLNIFFFLLMIGGLSLLGVSAFTSLTLFGYALYVGIGCFVAGAASLFNTAISYFFNTNENFYRPLNKKIIAMYNAKIRVLKQGNNNIPKSNNKKYDVFYGDVEELEIFYKNIKKNIQQHITNKDTDIGAINLATGLNDNKNEIQDELTTEQEKKAKLEKLNNLIIATQSFFKNNKIYTLLLLLITIFGLALLAIPFILSSIPWIFGGIFLSVGVGSLITAAIGYLISKNSTLFNSNDKNIAAIGVGLFFGYPFILFFIITMGGYLAFPTTLAAFLFGIPVLLSIFYSQSLYRFEKTNTFKIGSLIFAVILLGIGVTGIYQFAPKFIILASIISLATLAGLVRAAFLPAPPDLFHQNVQQQNINNNDKDRDNTYEYLIYTDKDYQEHLQLVNSQLTPCNKFFLKSQSLGFEDEIKDNKDDNEKIIEEVVSKIDQKNKILKPD